MKQHEKKIYKENTMKKNALHCLKGVLTAYALTTTFHAPFFLYQFETVFDYIIASIYELLGEYLDENQAVNTAVCADKIFLLDTEGF